MTARRTHRIVKAGTRAGASHYGLKCFLCWPHPSVVRVGHLTREGAALVWLEHLTTVHGVS